MPTHHDPSQCVGKTARASLALVPQAVSSALVILDLLKSLPARLSQINNKRTQQHDVRSDCGQRIPGESVAFCLNARQLITERHKLRGAHRCHDEKIQSLE